MSQIIPLSSQSNDAIESLLDAAFGTDRHGRTAYRIRQGMTWMPQFSYAMVEDSGELSGLLQSWPVSLSLSDNKGDVPLIMVGPVAVMPAHQGAGYGRAMMDQLVLDADMHAQAPLMMIGDPEYYGRFWGFSADATAGWDAPGPFDARRMLSRDVPHAPPLPSSLVGMLAPQKMVESKNALRSAQN